MLFTDQSSSILSTTCSGSTGCGASLESSEQDEPPAKRQQFTSSYRSEDTVHNDDASDDRDML